MNKNITKLIVDFFLTIFIITSILIILLLVIYYFTPNNYIIENFNISKYILIKEITLKCNPNLTKKLDYLDYSNNYIKFNLETNLLIKNIFKSQNIICTTNDTLQINFNSDVFIINTKNEEINLIISIYSKI